MANALDDVQYTYLSVDKQYTMLHTACVGSQAGDLADKYATAEFNYDKCIGQMLSDDDATVAVLKGQLKVANTVVDQSVELMGNMSKVIDNIDQAVKLGTTLIAKIP